jgi:hypothetical protein
MGGGEMTNWKKFLTENVLGECWDADKRPGGDLPNRTFDNFSDLMSLYEEIFKDINKWAVFIVYSNGIFWRNYRPHSSLDKAQSDFSAWLFCSAKVGHEDRCKMVAEFYGWEETATQTLSLPGAGLQHFKNTEV